MCLGEPSKHHICITLQSTSKMSYVICTEMGQKTKETVKDHFNDSEWVKNFENMIIPEILHLIAEHQPE